MKTAIVHYWLVGMRGGEKVIEELCKLYPEADIYTLVLDSKNVSNEILKHRIITSFLQKIGGKKNYQKMLPLMPFALESFDLTGYDLVISSEAGPAKGVVTNPESIHICYCHSPMRYIWDQQSQYLRGAGILAKVTLRIFGPFLRQWDISTSNRVDYFIANSEFVSKRIRKTYRRESVVINPPVDLDRFSLSDAVDDVYICAGQVTPYKRIDIAIEAFSRMGKRLDIIGSGITDRMKRSAGPTVFFFGPLSDEEMALRFSRCKALIYPGLEDFGIIPLEVMASGRPVVAYGRGGAAETVKDGVTGVLFYEQTTDALVAAIERFESIYKYITPEACVERAGRFSAGVFREKIMSFINQVSQCA